MNTEEYRQHLKRLPETHPFYQRMHPFWRACFRGQLPREALHAWARDTYPFVRDFPRFYLHVAAKAGSTEALTFLGETIYEETGSGEVKESHANLFTGFMEALGVSRSDLPPEPPSVKGHAVWKYVWDTTREGSYLEGLACVGLGIERPLPEFYGFLAKAFGARYGVAAKALRYFTIHTVADVKHSQIALRLVAESAATTEQRSSVESAITRLWDIQLEQLDELWVRYGEHAPVGRQ
jgi:pyrroloquinoline quinone (PQQ) biosynthesis protein C